MPKPFFSIVIPTRNRAHIVKRAVQSILDQTFGDFEIIVGNNFSTDDTRKAIQGFRDERVRYFETEKSLGMCGSFEFATSHARGEYITYLSDDDACSVVALEIIAGAIESSENNKLIAWTYCDYLLDAVGSGGYGVEANSVWISSFDGRMAAKNSKETIRNRLAMGGLLSEPTGETDHKKYPALINAAYHRSLFSEIEKRGLRFFYPLRSAVKSCAVNDLYALVITLSLIDEYLYVDYPLHIHGAWAQSATTTLDGSRKYYRASEEELLVPFRCYTNKTFAGNALLLAKREVGEDLSDIRINWARFYQAVYAELSDIGKAGVDVGEDLANLFAALEKESPEFQAAVRSKFPSELRISRDKLVNNAKKLLRPIYQKIGLSAAVNRARKDQSDSAFLVKGGESGFDNILEFARKMDKKWLGQFKLDDSEKRKV